MCGIVGIASQSDCIPNLVNGLKALEYRGYDSAGIATIKKDIFTKIKSLGKIKNLEDKILKCKIMSNIGIAHTRWATHGKPLIKNTHPFVKKRCALVHNGIIENYEDLIKYYSIDINALESETDSEVIAEIFNKLLQQFNSPIEAMQTLLKNVEGTFSFAFIIKGSNSIYAVRKGSPLLLGLSKNKKAISSDLLGLPKEISDVIFLEENDIVQFNHSTFSIFDKNGILVKREIHKHESHKEAYSKGNYKHFMLKEIFQQPVSIEDTVLNYVDKRKESVHLTNCNIDFNNITKLNFVGCGTAYHACMIAKYWFEHFTKISTSVDIGSEYRYRDNLINKNELGIVISQSGETMDTLESLKKLKKNNIFTFSIVNVLSSSIARTSDYILPTLAGREIGVASTKAFTSQLTMLALFAQFIQKQKKIDNRSDNKIFHSLFDLPKKLDEVLRSNEKFKSISSLLKDAKSIFYIGRGTMYPLALEGALKLKEITYKHCEGYAAGELKHGPLALIEKDIPVIALGPYDNNFLKLLSNIQEVKARDGKIILISDNKGVKLAKKYCEEVIIMPDTNFLTAPITYALSIQLIAYYVASLLGTDIDQPRNLAKSVTVE
ncbi:glutamine--fructose-6-phosphate transaminase (isomerizing) [Alphaproteobacteria bacterium]|nr:glutamine--fructose-6-phosphate transaminase (isomerizing) [Alphaproteobacteria bacterium]